MRCEILTVGTELLLGLTVDTNASYMGRLLADAGITVTARATVGDDPAAVADAVRAALGRADALVISGGLGPTKDDLTRSAVASVLGRRLVRDAGWMERLEALYRQRGMPMPAANAVQADLPDGAERLDNPIGTAPGIWIEDQGRVVVMVPGVPKEMAQLMSGTVVPRLAARAAGAGAPRVVRSRTVRTTGIGESALADAAGDYQALLGSRVTLAFLPSLAGTDLRFTAWDLPPDEADAALAAAVAALAPRLGAHVYGEGDDDLAAVVLARLEAEGARLALAESCTGGLVGARLTAIPGSSRVLLGGVVAYADEVKLHQLGVSADTLAAHGAVSEAVVREMAEGAARVFGADAAIAISGVAGPGGGTEAKPVGTVWVAVRWRDATRAFTWIFPGDREDVRHRAAQWALDRLRRVMTRLP